MSVPPQGRLFIHGSRGTSGALAEGRFSLTGDRWARTGSEDAVARTRVPRGIRGSVGGVWDFDEIWTGGRGLDRAGWRNEALDRA